MKISMSSADFTGPLNHIITGEATPVSLEEIDGLDIWSWDKEEIKQNYNHHTYKAEGIGNSTWIIIPFTGGCIGYSYGHPPSNWNSIATDFK